jgi:hypothetical protein
MGICIQGAMPNLIMPFPELDNHFRLILIFLFIYIHHYVFIVVFTNSNFACCNVHFSSCFDPMLPVRTLLLESTNILLIVAEYTVCKMEIY